MDEAGERCYKRPIEAEERQFIWDIAFAWIGIEAQRGLIWREERRQCCLCIQTSLKNTSIRSCFMGSCCVPVKLFGVLHLKGLSSTIAVIYAVPA